MSHASKPKLLLTVERATSVDPELIAGLADRFDVRVRAVRGPGRPRAMTKRISKKRLVADELLFFARLLTSPSLYRSTGAFASLNGHYATLLFARISGAFSHGKRTFLLSLYLHRLGQSRVVKGILAFLLTKDVRLVAHSTADADYFRQFLPEESILRVPYCQGPSRFVPFSIAESGNYVFSGGWTNRDYDALLRCASRLPHVPFIIVASVHSTISERPPANVSLLRDRGPAQFDRLLAKCRFVVIPLKDDVGSSGQMVLLSAMQFAKTTVVPRIGAVADYVEDGRTGIFYELGDDESLANAIGGLYDDEHRTAEIGHAARESYLSRFTPRRWNYTVVDYIDKQVTR
jgi:glycosyltransferase involved in cell wall biosynthesis